MNVTVEHFKNPVEGKYKLAYSNNSVIKTETYDGELTAEFRNETAILIVCGEFRKRIAVLNSSGYPILVSKSRAWKRQVAEHGAIVIKHGRGKVTISGDNWQAFWNTIEALIDHPELQPASCFAAKDPRLASANQ